MQSQILPIIGTAGTLLIAGCTQPTGGTPEPRIDQANLCEVNNWRIDATAGACKPGQKVVFLPSSWGNEQLPVIFAAVNCDLRYAVALTNGAVSCIYSPITPAKKQAETSPAPPK